MDDLGFILSEGKRNFTLAYVIITIVVLTLIAIIICARDD